MAFEHRHHRRIAWVVIPILALSALILVDPPAGWSETPVPSGPAPSEPTDDLAMTRETLARMRDVGSVLYSYMAVELEKKGLKPAPASWDGAGDWGECRPVPASVVQSLDVPAPLAEWPVVDGWGNPFEFCLAEAFPQPRAAVGVRSPGSDGRYSGPDYVFGPFPAAETAHDIVWIDGFFATYPEAGGRSSEEESND